MLSKLEYGTQIYASDGSSTLKELDPVHNEDLWICTGAFRSSPVISLEVEAGSPWKERTMPYMNTKRPRVHWKSKYVRWTLGQFSVLRNFVYTCQFAQDWKFSVQIYMYWYLFAIWSCYGG